MTGGLKKSYVLPLKRSHTSIRLKKSIITQFLCTIPQTLRGSEHRKGLETQCPPPDPLPQPSLPSSTLATSKIT